MHLPDLLHHPGSSCPSQLQGQRSLEHPHLKEEDDDLILSTSVTSSFTWHSIEKVEVIDTDLQSSPHLHLLHHCNHHHPRCCSHLHLLHTYNKKDYCPAFVIFSLDLPAATTSTSALVLWRLIPDASPISVVSLLELPILIRIVIST